MFHYGGSDVFTGERTCSVLTTTNPVALPFLVCKSQEVKTEAMFIVTDVRKRGGSLHGFILKPSSELM